MNITLENTRFSSEETLEQWELIKREAYKLSLGFISLLKSILFQFLYSYKEFSFSNIREIGLTEVFMIRAMRFFGIEYLEDKNRGDEEEKNRKNEKESFFAVVKSTSKKVAVKGFKIIIFPFYICVVIWKELFSKSKKIENKKLIPKKNIYVNYNQKE